MFLGEHLFEIVEYAHAVEPVGFGLAVVPVENGVLSVVVHPGAGVQLEHLLIPGYQFVGQLQHPSQKHNRLPLEHLHLYVLSYLLNYRLNCLWQFLINVARVHLRQQVTDQAGNSLVLGLSDYRPQFVVGDELEGPGSDDNAESGHFVFHYVDTFEQFYHENYLALRHALHLFRAVPQLI